MHGNQVLHERRVAEFHPLYGWTERPSTQFLWKTDPRVGWKLNTFNDEGYRDLFDSGDKTIITIGDSFMRGALAGDRETIPFLMDFWMPEIAVKDFSASGYGTNNYVMVYQDKAKRLSHDWVVVGHYLGNDLLDNMYARSEAPRFVLKENGRVELARLPVSPDSASAATEPVSPVRDVTYATALDSLTQGLQDLVARNSAAYRYFVPRAQRLLSLRGSSESPPVGRELAAMLQLCSGLLEEVAATAAESNSRVLLVIIAERGELVPGQPLHYWQEDGQVFWDEQRHMLASFSERHSHVFLVDPSAALLA